MYDNLESVKRDVYRNEKRKLFIKMVITNIVVLFAFLMTYSTKTSNVDPEIIDKTMQINMENDSLRNIISNELSELKKRENNIIRKTLNVSEDTNYFDLSDYSVDDLNSYINNRHDDYSNYNKSIDAKWDSIMGTPNVMPISLADLKEVSDGYGYRKHPILRRWIFHQGVDLAAKLKTPVYATADGIVIQKVKSRKGYGNKITIEHGYGYKTVYAHLYSFNVKSGQKVKKGDVIGYVGTTGLSTGPHLHYEILVDNKSVDPNLYLLYDDKIAMK